MRRYQKLFVILQRVYRESKQWQKVRLKYPFVEKIASFQTDRRNKIPVLFACDVLYCTATGIRNQALLRSYQGLWRYLQRNIAETHNPMLFL